ncbi:MAG: hypothetical protein JWO69_278 [Thermoleophilia bacterium]|nr:hypothetical protein [Thermoleophilia bacterium]
MLITSALPIPEALHVAATEAQRQFDLASSFLSRVPAAPVPETALAAAVVNVTAAARIAIGAFELFSMAYANHHFEDPAVRQAYVAARAVSHRAASEMRAYVSVFDRARRLPDAERTAAISKLQEAFATHVPAFTTSVAALHDLLEGVRALR